jgi:hypothetical protein
VKLLIYRSASRFVDQGKSAQAPLRLQFSNDFGCSAAVCIRLCVGTVFRFHVTAIEIRLTFPASDAWRFKGFLQPHPKSGCHSDPLSGNPPKGVWP